jgi:hypothetical protein
MNELEPSHDEEEEVELFKNEKINTYTETTNINKLEPELIPAQIVFENTPLAKYLQNKQNLNIQLTKVKNITVHENQIQTIHKQIHTYQIIIKYFVSILFPYFVLNNHYISIVHSQILEQIKLNNIPQNYLSFNIYISLFISSICSFCILFYTYLQIQYHWWMFTGCTIGILNIYEIIVN